MIGNDERRRVAERLRKLSGLDYCKDPRYAVELCSDAIGADHGNGYSWDKMLGRLADLIDPGCDRDALLAVADEMEEVACGSLVDMLHRDHVAAGWVWTWLGRIREACGEAGL